MASFRWLLAAPLLLTSCLTLDGFIFNAVPCTEIDESTCDPDLDAWSQLCIACEEPYDWEKAYPWMPGTLADGESIRPVDPDLVAQYTVPTDDGEGALDVWMLRAHGDDPVLATTTILYSHGNYASIEHYQPRVRMLHEAGYNVMVWDYRGYGKTTPHEPPTPEQFMADARQVRRWARGMIPDDGRLVIYGYSLGALPAVEMAVDSPGCALILESPFSSFEALGEGNTRLSLGERFFSDGRLSNLSKMPDLDTPLLAMAGTEDRTTPVVKVEELFELAPQPKELWVLDGVDHGIRDGGIPEAGLAAYTDKLRSFLRAEAPACVLEL